MLIRTLMVAATAAALSATGALADEYAGGAIMSMETDNGEILTDADGMTLYTFDNDSGGMSACYDDCAVNWPPLIAAEGAKADGDYTLVERKDGSMQWAYDGKPLYLWKDDKAPGDMTGDGKGGVWHVAVEE